MTYVLSRATASPAGADPGPCWQVRHIRYIHIWDTWVAPKRHCHYICRYITSSGVRSSVLGQARKRAQKQKRKRGRHAPHLGCDDRPRKDHGTARCPWPGPLSLTHTQCQVLVWFVLDLGAAVPGNRAQKQKRNGTRLVASPWGSRARSCRLPRNARQGLATVAAPIYRTLLSHLSKYADAHYSLLYTKCWSGTGHCCSTYIVCAHAHT